MTFDTDTAIRVLTMMALGGLLLSAGLRLTWAEIADSLRQNRLGWVLPVNFILVPAMTFGVVRLFQLPTHLAAGMMILAAAPFAPVVPVFARMARADLALASALTGLFPFLAAFLTPVVCELGLKPLLGASALKFSFASILIVLVSTITLPLALGVVLRHCWPLLARRLLKPVEIISETAGTISLVFVTVVEFQAIRSTGWKPLLLMALVSELSFFAGYALSGPSRAARFVVGLGTANRNIALALLVAVESFPGTPILAAVVANGLLLIGLGLVHVGLWRWLKPARGGV
jgi:bile acid:Na+ symporter, BASS family